MSVSVIIPCFNRELLLARAIESVLAQNYAGLELIVVDDGSTDGTEKLVLESYPCVHYIKQDNQGVSAARNAGLRVASGEWIALLDSDDEWLSGKLEKQLATLKQTQLKVCHTEEVWIRDGVRVNQMNKHKKRGGSIFEHCLPLCAMSPSSIMIHRSVFDEVGVFDEALPACEDYDLWLRITARYEVAYVEQACIRKYGGHQDQLSRQFWGMDRFRVIALDNLLSDQKCVSCLSLDMKNAALKMLLKKLKILHKGALKHANHELIIDCEARLARWEL